MRGIGASELETCLISWIVGKNLAIICDIAYFTLTVDTYFV